MKKLFLVALFVFVGCENQPTTPKTITGVPLSVSHGNWEYVNGLSIIIRDTDGKLKVCEGFTKYSTMGCFSIIDLQIKERQIKNIEIIGEENDYDYIIMSKIKVHLNDNEEYDFSLDFVR